MKKFSPSLFLIGLGFLASASPVQAQTNTNDILSILAQKAEIAVPTTIPYSYTLSVKMRETDGDEITDGEAILRINPMNPPGSRATLISATDPESEALLDMLKDIEDPEKDTAERADGFWCGGIESGDAFNPEDFEIIAETQTEAIIKPRAGKLAELLMQSDETADKKARKMQKKLAERIDGEMTLSKPDVQVKGFRVTMTRPLKMMLVAKLKVMDVEQNCKLAPNGFYHMSSMQMNVQGKAMGSAFGQDMNIQISELTPLP